MGDSTNQKPEKASPKGSQPKPSKGFSAKGKEASKKPYSPKKEGAYKPFKSKSDRPYGKSSGKPYEKREGQSSGRPSGPREGKPYEKREGQSSDRSYGKPAGKPYEKREGRPYEKREGQSFGRPSGPREGKPYEKREGQSSDRSYGKPAGRPYEKREGQSFGRPSGPREGKPYEKREGQSFGRPSGPREGRPYEKREGQSFNRPSGPREGRPYEKREGQSFGRPSGPREGKPYQKREGQSFGRPAPPNPKNTARYVALTALNEVTQQEAYGSISLDRQLQNAPLTPVERRLATQLLYGTLENQIHIDFALEHFIKNREEVNLKVWNILRLSLYQMIFLDKIPESAAVNEGVNLVKLLEMDYLTGFVNGVLRNFTREKDQIAWPKEEENPAEYLSVHHSMPLWLVEELMKDYGYEKAKAICAYQNPQQGIPLRPNTMKISMEKLKTLLEEKQWEVTPGAFDQVLWVKGADNIGKDEDYQKGLYSIQGEGSLLAAQAVDVRPGMSVLDVCAAPGGKTAFMAEQMQGTGRVQAWDKHEHRVELLKAMKKRLQLENVRPMVKDASLPREDLVETFDRVLIDAPCSGLGVMWEKPDVKYRHSLSSVEALAKEQEGILDACAPYVKPGGLLVYSTCSILARENQCQVENFLQKHPEFALAPMLDQFPEALKEKGKKEGLQLLPMEEGVEGFFMARFEKKGKTW